MDDSAVKGKRATLNPTNEWPAEFFDCLGAWREEIPKPPSGIVGFQTAPAED